MIKRVTGKKFTPQYFRTLEQCVECGKALDYIGYGDRCNDCKRKNLPKCEMCEGILRNGEFLFYSYDNRELNRDEVEFKISKELIVEFISKEQIDSRFSDELCIECKDWKERMKDICFFCDNDFFNSKQHYKLNGNMCNQCVVQSLKLDEEL